VTVVPMPKKLTSFPSDGNRPDRRCLDYSCPSNGMVCKKDAYQNTESRPEAAIFNHRL
jgi:hypothetical protein